MPAFQKSLEGITMTDELRTLLTKSAVETTSDQQQHDDDDDERLAADSSTSSSSVVSIALKPLSVKESQSILQDIHITTTETLSLTAVRAMYSVFLASDDKPSLAALNTALASTTLQYTSPPVQTELTEEQKRFRKRMERLKLKNEETKYRKITNNLDTSVDDDVTTKSMTYAASVGLNMIVAPISFGVFAYFFAGHVLDWFLPRQVELKSHETDIRRVIAGVLSGVIMMFIEMILFVIRTHEFDASLRKKRRMKYNQGVSPFGYTRPSEQQKVD